MKAHTLGHSLSRLGNYHDNAVAESFFNLPKHERIRRRTYKTCEDAGQFRTTSEGQAKMDKALKAAAGNGKFQGFTLSLA